MKPATACLAFLLLTLAACSPSSPTTSDASGPPAFSAPSGNLPDISVVKRWVNGIGGKSAAEVRGLLSGHTPISEPWQHEDIGGEKLVYQFADYDLEVYLVDDRCELVSFDIYAE